jgi:chemosensory pili system protein ChpA (sensor histidine kinase/response regulator)
MSSARPRACSCSTHAGQGRFGVSDRLAQDLLFFCAQAVPTPGAPGAEAVRGPGTWRASAGGLPDAAVWPLRPGAAGAGPQAHRGGQGNLVGAVGRRPNKLKAVADQFSLVTDSLVKLHPAAPAGAGLNKRHRSTVRSGQPPVAPNWPWKWPRPCSTWRPRSKTWTRRHRAGRDAHRAPGQRLDHVRAGGPAEALEPWMEELYRRVSDRQTMGSVVGELRSTLSELEKLLDQFFRNPAGQGPCAMRRRSCRRCVACCRCWAWTRPRRPCCACATASKRSW